MNRTRLVLAAVMLTLVPVAPLAHAGPPTVRVGGIVLKWIRGDKEANYRRAEPLIRQAAQGGAKIVCTTECFLDGYAIADKSIPLETYRALGEPIPAGPYFQRLANLADELDIHLIAGMLEADGDLRYNTAVLLAPDGSLAGKYRKQKLQHELVRNTPGNQSSVFDTSYGKLGVMICADRTEPGIVGRFCAAGADFLICPSGGMFGPRKNDPIVSARSRENGVSIVFVHPAEFLVTAPGGDIVTAELLGDRLLIDLSDAGTAVDSQAVRYYDLPLGEKSPPPTVPLNGSFAEWPGYTGQGVTTTSVGVPPNSIFAHWYGGPGAGATATYDAVAFPPEQTDVPGSPKQHLRVSWQESPSQDWPGEAHHQPDFRFTFLENFTVGDVKRFAGHTLSVSFHARIAEGSTASGPVLLTPIMWHSYDSQTPGIVAVKGKGYELFESSGKPGEVAVAQGTARDSAVCQVTEHWQRFEKLITLPSAEGKSITAGNYTGVGFDLATRQKLAIDLANVQVHDVLQAPLATK